jgi:hypothetical protein
MALELLLPEGFFGIMNKQLQHFIRVNDAGDEVPLATPALQLPTCQHVISHCYSVFGRTSYTSTTTSTYLSALGIAS